MSNGKISTCQVHAIKESLQEEWQYQTWQYFKGSTTPANNKPSAYQRIRHGRLVRAVS